MPCSGKKFPGSTSVKMASVTIWVSNPRNRAEEKRLVEEIEREGRRKAQAHKERMRKSQEEKKRDLERRRGDSYRPAPHISPAESGQAVNLRVMNAPRGPVADRPRSHTNSPRRLVTQSPYSQIPGAQFSHSPRRTENTVPSNASSENSVIDRLEMALFPQAHNMPSLAPSSPTINNTFGQSQQIALQVSSENHPNLVRQSPPTQYDASPTEMQPGARSLLIASDPFFSQSKIALEQKDQIPKEIEDQLLSPTPTSDAPSLPENVPQPFNLFQPSKPPLINPFRSPTKETTPQYRFGQPSQPATPNLSIFTSPDKQNIPKLGSNEETVPELRRRVAFWHEAWQKHDKELEELKDLQRAKDKEIFKLREERIAKNKELDRLKHLLTAAEEAGRELEKRNQAAMRALEGRN